MKNYEKFIDKQLEKIKDQLMKSYDEEEIKCLSLHNIQSFQDGSFSRIKKDDKLKLQISFNGKQFCRIERCIPRSPKDWRIQPLILLVWKDELEEDEK